MKLTVLGKYSPFAPAHGAGVGYWIACGETGVLVDCGPGVLARFQAAVGPLSLIEKVLLSHLHFDHISDMMVLRYASYPDGRYAELPKSVDVYCPPEPEPECHLLNYKGSLVVHPIPERDGLRFGDVGVTFLRGEHGIPSYIMRFQGPGGVLVYSGDTRPCEALVEAARGADLFLCEASAVEADKEFAAPGHVTARQAGEIAQEAGVKKLLLTHIWPLYDEAQILSECRAVFPQTEIVKECQVHSTSSKITL